MYQQYEQEFSYSSATNNNTARGRLWNVSITSDNPSGMHLIEADGNQAQRCTPHGMIQYDSAPSGNSLTLAGGLSGMNMLNGLPMLGNPTSTKRPKIGRGRYNCLTQVSLQIIPSNYVVTDQYGQKNCMQYISTLLG